MTKGRVADLRPLGPVADSGRRLPLGRSRVIGLRLRETRRLRPRPRRSPNRPRHRARHRHRRAAPAPTPKPPQPAPSSVRGSCATVTAASGSTLQVLGGEVSGSTARVVEMTRITVFHPCYALIAASALLLAGCGATSRQSGQLAHAGPGELVAERCPDLHHCDTVRHGPVRTWGAGQRRDPSRDGGLSPSDPGDHPVPPRSFRRMKRRRRPGDHLLDGRRPSGGRCRRGLNAVERHPRQLFNCGKSSSRNSVAGRSPDSFSRPRSSTRRILPEIVFGSSANSSRRIRL